MVHGPLALRSRCLFLPKQGNSREEYEDASAADDGTGKFAVADGASESIGAGEWAKMLTDAFVADAPSAETFSDWLNALQKRWQAEVGNQTAPWYIEEKLRDGAFATFLGLNIEGTKDSGVASWRALAVGDSCLFRVRGNSNVRSFPMKSAESFGTRPELIGSRAKAVVAPLHSKGTLRAGDRLLLATDALAQWFLAEIEAGRKPWRELIRLTEEQFVVWTATLRQNKQLKNDDVTLLIIEIDKRDP